MKFALLMCGLFALAFLTGQLWVWQHLRQLGYLVASNPANSFFFLLTGLHGLHLMGGLVAWVVVLARARHPVSFAKARANVDLCALYWHFLFVVWLVLFALLMTPQNTLGALAAICGF
jgi:cytochrome c oxidase subunit 3